MGYVVMSVSVPHHLNVNVPAKVEETTREIVRYGLHDLADNTEKLKALSLATLVVLSEKQQELATVRDAPVGD
jgi:hypothetical protein